MHSIFELNTISLTYLIFSYFLGSIPFGYIIYKFKTNDDIRKFGSGNIGATNVNRLIGKKFGFITLFFDFIKGAISTYLGYTLFGTELGLLCGFFCLIGHMFPIWLKFKGGKGVASFIGYILIISWPITILFIIFWVVSVKIFKVSAIGAIISLILNIIFFKLLLYVQFKFNILLWIPGEPIEFYAIFLISLLVIIKHRKNIMTIFY